MKGLQKPVTQAQSVVPTRCAKMNQVGRTSIMDMSVSAKTGFKEME